MVLLDGASPGHNYLALSVTADLDHEDSGAPKVGRAPRTVKFAGAFEKINTTYGMAATVTPPEGLLRVGVAAGQLHCAVTHW